MKAAVERDIFRALTPAFRELGDARSGAFTVSKIADIRVTQGELTEALRLCRSRRVFFFLRRNNESYASEPA